MGDRRLLFVNKTRFSSLLSQSEARERAQILCHVQRNRRGAEGTLPAPPPPWLEHAHTIEVEAASNTPEREAAANSVQSRVSLSDHHYPPSNSSDPFHCTVAGPEPGLHALLQQGALASESRSNFLAEAFAPESIVVTTRRASASAITTRHGSIFTRRLQQCVVDQTLMYATLAYGSSFIGWAVPPRARARALTDSLQQPPEYYVVKAIRGVRERLSVIAQDHSAPDDWLMLSIYSLAITDLWSAVPEMGHPNGSNNYSATGSATALSGAVLDACRVHLSAALRVVHEVGGWDSFHPYIVDSFILADKFLAIVQLSPPVIPLTWDTSSLLYGGGGDGVGEEMRDVFGRYTTTKSATPRAMGSAFAHTQMTACLRELIHDIVSYCGLALAAWSNENAGDVTFEHELWLFRRQQALICRLLLCYNRAESTSVVGRCICLGTLVFLLSCTAHRGPQLAGMFAARHLRQFLLDNQPTILVEMGHGSDLHQWLVCTGAMAMICSSRERDWFVVEFARLFQDNVQGLDANILQPSLERFFFLPNRQGARLLDLVQRTAAAIKGNAAGPSSSWSNV